MKAPWYLIGSFSLADDFFLQNHLERTKVTGCFHGVRGAMLLLSCDGDSWDILPGVGLLGHKAILLLMFLRKSWRQLFLIIFPSVLIIYQKSKSYSSYFFMVWNGNSKPSNFEHNWNKLDHILLTRVMLYPMGLKQALEWGTKVVGISNLWPIKP